MFGIPTRLWVLNCPVCTLGDEDEDEDDETASQPLSSAALIKLAEGEEDVVEDLQLSDDDD